MHILLSNDDGFQAPGLICLAKHLARIADVSVVAPDRDRSGASNSLTLTRPLRAHRESNGFVRVDGTPTDCVHLAITGLLEREPDMVVSGINAGANMGDDVIYSGTVAAAMEGRSLGLPAIAVSMASYQPRHFDTAAELTCRLIQSMDQHEIPSDTILNLNVPDVSIDKIQGMDATRLGARHKAEPMVKSTDPRGLDVYWVGAAGPEQDAGEGTDFFAVRNNRASVTPLQVDLTRHQARDSLGSWLEAL